MISQLRPLLIALLVFAPVAASASPAEDANALVDRWAADFNTNDAAAIVKLYTTDAILLGTVSSIIADKPELIRDYFKRLPGSGAKVKIGDHRTLVLNNDVVLVTGFYEFTTIRKGKPMSIPARFSIIAVKRGNDWLIAHHHSSRRPAPTQ